MASKITWNSVWKIRVSTLMLERFLESIGVQGRLIFVGLLVISLGLELSGNFWLGAIAKIAKTAARILYNATGEKKLRGRIRTFANVLLLLFWTYLDYRGCRSICYSLSHH